MATTAQFCASWRNALRVFRPADTTRALLIFKAAAAIGSRLHVLIGSSTDTADQDIIQYHGTQATLCTVAAAGVITKPAGGVTITRTVGSFITDGWQVGDIGIGIGNTTIADDKTLTITGVAALTLTFTESVTVEALPITAILYRVSQISRHKVPLNAGNTNAISNVDLLKDNNAAVDSTPNRYMTFGPNDALIMAMAATITAAKYVSVTAEGGDY